MNWFERWHESARRDTKRQDEFIRKYYDLGTWAGIFRGLLTWGVAWYVLWHFYDIMDWFHDLTGGRQSDPVTPGQIRWVRLCASVMCFPPILLTILALIMLPINRYRARKYAQRQEQGIPETDEGTAELVSQTGVAESTLPTEETETLGTAESVFPPQDWQMTDPMDIPFGKPTWNDEPQEPVGKPPPAGAEPPQQFGDARLENREGRITLVVPNKQQRKS